MKINEYQAIQLFEIVDRQSSYSPMCYVGKETCENCQFNGEACDWYYAKNLVDEIRFQNETKNT